MTYQFFGLNIKIIIIMENILPLDEFSKIKGEIYKIVNKINNKIYIGQTRTYRKNKNKYRIFGYIRRFKDHISEAINNTKKKQCTYLNNAIRLDKDSFIVELLETCEINILDEREKYYINEYKSLFPDGYNLTSGGKTTNYIKVESNETLKDYKKRGRSFNYIHTDETKQKMKNSLLKMNHYLKSVASTTENKNRVSNIIKKYYDEKKIKKIIDLDLSKDYKEYIKEVYDKDGNICNYKIYFNRNNRFFISSKYETLEQKYERLKNIILKAKELKSKNDKDDSKE